MTALKQGFNAARLRSFVLVGQEDPSEAINIDSILFKDVIFPSLNIHPGCPTSLLTCLL